MDNINGFSKEVCNKLNYYVYRLIDPRNGQTFYVGKGKNNRVFAHVKCALADYNDVDYDSSSDNEENLKYKTIKLIKEAGLEVIYIIQKYGLSEHDAYVVESALIDAYSLDNNLANITKGFDSKEPTNAITLQKRLCAPEYTDSPNNPKYMIIKVNEYWLNQRNDRYECTRSAWKVNIEKAKKYQYVLSVTDGMVCEVYKVNGWHACPNRNGRAEFTGEIA